MNRHLLSISLVGAALLAGACGDSDDPRPAAAATAAAPQDHLESYLVRDGEEPGFRRAGEPFSDGFAGFTSGEEFTEQSRRALRRAGFVKIVAQPLEGPRGPGLSNVQLFRTARGARAALRYDQRADVIRTTLPADTRIRRFTVPGVPGARGWEAADFVNVTWVQGRCMLLLGNADNPTARTDLAAGVRAIHRRTQGRCP